MRNHEKRKHFKGHLISNVKFGGMKYSKEEVYACNTGQKSCMTLSQNKVLVPEGVFSLGVGDVSSRVAWPWVR